MNTAYDYILINIFIFGRIGVYDNHRFCKKYFCSQENIYLAKY